MDLGDPISYLTLSEGTPVFAAGGARIGVVEHVLADANADVFDGLVIDGRTGPGGAPARRAAGGCAGGVGGAAGGAPPRAGGGFRRPRGEREAEALPEPSE